MPFEGFPRNTSSNQEIRKVHPEDILPSLSPERREDILEIVDFCISCVQRYLQMYSIPPITRDDFFLFDAEGTKKRLGFYDPKRRMFGVHVRALHAPHIIIHEMLHFLSAQQGSKISGFRHFEFDSESEKWKTIYEAVDEGMTDLMTQDIYSHEYASIKRFFKPRGGINYKSSAYGEAIVFIQKLVYHRALIESREQNIPEEEAHRRVWDDLKQAYLGGNHDHLESLFDVFAKSKEESFATKDFIKPLTPTKYTVGRFGFLIKILDKKITDLRTWLGTL